VQLFLRIGKLRKAGTSPQNLKLARGSSAASILVAKRPGFPRPKKAPGDAGAFVRDRFGDQRPVLYPPGPAELYPLVCADEFAELLALSNCSFAEGGARDVLRAWCSEAAAIWAADAVSSTAPRTVRIVFRIVVSLIKAPAKANAPRNMCLVLEKTFDDDDYYAGADHEAASKIWR
jgi:hypothetical protein